MSKITREEIIELMPKTRVIKYEQLKEILDNHKKWLNFEHEGERAILPCALFIDVILDDVNLSYAILTMSLFKDLSLVRANFKGADLRGVNFSGSDLKDSDFTGADLTQANLDGTNLTGANFTDATLDYITGTPYGLLG